MQEFRPADVIEQDTVLAKSLADGDLDVLDVLIDRYGRAVHAVVATGVAEGGESRAVEVFAQAWMGRTGIEPGSDFAHWIGGLAAADTPSTPEEVDVAWSVAMAIEAVDDAIRPALRAHHLVGGELQGDEDRHELRLRRRLAHLGDDDAVAVLLANPVPWTDLADVGAQVRTRLGIGASDADADIEQPQAAGVDAGAEAGAPGQRQSLRPSKVSRALRPVLLGLAGAVVVLFVAIIALSAASGSPDPIAFTGELVPTGAIADVDGGELTVTERDAGLRLDLEAPTLPRRAGDQVYEGLLVLRDGTEVAVGTFNEGFDVTLSGGVSLDRVESFLVVTREVDSDRTEVVLKLDVPQR